ncbi:MAG TPA: zf-HC2 domain-containing protein [Burkholderiales bacterium]|nr:zf-HC2 domain-containing protein [Burkholderiales bacterium]
MKPILSCREVTRLVSQGLDRRLGFGERVALRLHFAICRSCTRFNRQMSFLREGTRRLADAETLRNR